MINFDLKDPTGVSFETIMSMQQLTTNLYQKDLMTQEQLVPQGGAVPVQTTGENQ